MPYAAAVAAVTVATLVRLAIDPMLQDAIPFFTFFVAIIFATAYGGWRPGVLALVLSGIIADLLFIHSRTSFAADRRQELAALLSYAIAGALMVLLVQFLHRARRQAEASAREADFAHRQRRTLDARLLTVLRSIADGVIATDEQGRIVFINHVAERLTGWPAADAAGQPLQAVFRIISELTRQPAVNPIDQVLREGVVVGLANHTALITRDGQELCIDDSAAPIFDDAGKVSGAVLVFRDITQRRRAELELRRLAAIVQSSDDAIISQSLDGVVMSWNPAAQRLFGYTPEEIIGQSISLLIPAEGRDEHQKMMQRLRAGEQVEHLETTRRSKDGRLLTVSLSISPVRDSDGNIVGFSKISRDITNRKQVERDLRFLADASAALGSSLEYNEIIERLTRLAVPRIADYCLLFTPDANGGTALAAAAHVNADLETELREAIRLFKADPTAPPTPIAQVLRSGQSLLLRDASGINPGRFTRDPRLLEVLERLRPSSLLLVPLVARQNVLGVLGYFSTSTQRQYGEDSLPIAEELGRRAAFAIENARLYRQLQDALRAKDQFLAALSHELRTPLSPVLLAASSLEADPSLPESLRIDVRMIRRNVELETRLIDDLLDLTRITRGKLQLNIEPVDAHRVLQDALAVCLADPASKDLKLVTEFGAEDPLVLADPARLQQVFWNLIKNAMKFTPAGGMITLRSRRLPPPPAGNGALTGHQNGKLVIEVIDTGIGIEPAALPRLFDAFQQGDPTIGRRFGGLGLGLAISKALTEMHGGDLSAFSAGADQGSTFTLCWPLASGAAMSPTPPPPLEEKPASLRILLVEDHESTAQVISRILSRLNYRVTAAPSISIALSLAEENRFDLLISDLGLPDGSGLELMRQLKARYGLPGICLSGFGMEEDVQNSREAGFIEHMTKPISVEKLQAVIRRVTTTHLSGC